MSLKDSLKAMLSVWSGERQYKEVRSTAIGWNPDENQDTDGLLYEGKWCDENKRVEVRPSNRKAARYVRDDNSPSGVPEYYKVTRKAKHGNKK